MRFAKICPIRICSYRPHHNHPIHHLLNNIIITSYLRDKLSGSTRDVVKLMVRVVRGVREYTRVVQGFLKRSCDL